MPLMTAFRAASKTLLLGCGPLLAQLLEQIEHQPHCGYRVVGVVAPKAPTEAVPCGCPLLGSVDNLHNIIREQDPDVIIVAVSEDRTGLFDHQLLEAGLFRHIKIEHATAVYERLTGKLPIEAYAPEDVLYSDIFQPGRTTLLSARLLSLIVALTGSIVCAPLLLLIAALIKLDSSGPVLFTQQRSGFEGSQFKLLKFRTMHPCGQRRSEWESDNVNRITRVGYWLRKFRLDELPQFFNILKGDMNIVGPRPHPVSNFELLVLTSRNLPDSGVEIPYYSLRSRVLPGITGWAQVRYRYANNLQEELEKLRFDLYYIKHYSLWLDIRILLETVRIVVTGKGVSASVSQPEKLPVSSTNGQESSYERP